MPNDLSSLVGLVGGSEVSDDDDDDDDDVVVVAWEMPG